MNDLSNKKHKLGSTIVILLAGGFVTVASLLLVARPINAFAEVSKSTQNSK